MNVFEICVGHLLSNLTLSLVTCEYKNLLFLVNSIYTIIPNQIRGCHASALRKEEEKCFFMLFATAPTVEESVLDALDSIGGCGQWNLVKDWAGFIYP